MASWKTTVQRMNSSGARVQLIDSLDDWAQGTAIEPSAAWPSRSAFGTYLDALHAHSPAHAPLDALPTVASVAISGATVHTVSVVANLAPGSHASTWWVEYGATSAYGQAAPPVSVAASSSPKPATTALTALAPATTYHARVVVASIAGVVASDDATFTTLEESRAMRVAAAGDIACDPASSAFNGGAGTSTGVSPGRGLQRDPRRRVRRRARARRHAVQQRYGQSVRRLLPAELGPLPGNHPPRGRQSRVRQPQRRALLRVLRRCGRSPAKGYYSYELGAWHIIVLNANCTKIAGCHAGSDQEAWLRSDLTAHPLGCTLAYWHQPRFSSGQHGDDVFDEHVLGRPLHRRRGARAQRP